MGDSKSGYKVSDQTKSNKYCFRYFRIKTKIFGFEGRERRRLWVGGVGGAEGREVGKVEDLEPDVCVEQEGAVLGP